MSKFSEVEQAAPEFAKRVRRRFEMGTNKTIATLRRDGSPRISAIEVAIKDGEVTFGMMGDSLKLLDVRRDPRIAIHCATIEPPSQPTSDWPGDAKLAGIAVEIASEAGGQYPGAGFFRVDITEVTLTYVGSPANHLVIESWHGTRGWSRRTRR